MGAIRDQNDRTNWKWLSGEDVTVSFWNLPGGNEDCARYDGANGWLWSDTNCNAPINFICQHRKFVRFYEIFRGNVFKMHHLKKKPGSQSRESRL